MYYLKVATRKINIFSNFFVLYTPCYAKTSGSSVTVGHKGLQIQVKMA